MSILDIVAMSGGGVLAVLGWIGRRAASAALKTAGTAVTSEEAVTSGEVVTSGETVNPGEAVTEPVSASGAAASETKVPGAKVIGVKTAGTKAPDAKKAGRRRTLFSVLALAGLWLIAAGLSGALFGDKAGGDFEIAITVPQVKLFGISVSETLIVDWVIIAVLTVAGLIFRFAVFPRFTQVPHGFQTAMEVMVGELDKYIDSKLPGMSLGFGAYIFTISAYMIGCAVAEMFGARSPTSDITATLALSLMTFVLINYYGIKKKGLGGRIRALSNPTPMVFPIRVVCDCAVPVSMACRLFGNMLGGMIVMDLLYFAMGNASIAAPSLVGLYFNVFHPLIQAFIFVTLTLTFIGEATE